MPTPLKKPVTRRTIDSLDGSYGSDRGRRLVVTLCPGGKSREDYIELRPEGCQRTEVINIADIYRHALKCRVNRELLEKAREKKAKKAAQREQRSLDRAAKKLKQPIE